ncbi:uncharacterized protein LOC111620648 [Centruroides sculpturatus]|uniref:uncharacterized protein LOC111620648 n=1 Tax=Centruroides sculpturatus TaxID=218467 RepID=UPI000C6D67DF|nr:uncharacterized protein LOC111620648 [Centruroides sculpturatus]
MKILICVLLFFGIVKSFVISPDNFTLEKFSTISKNNSELEDFNLDNDRDNYNESKGGSGVFMHYSQRNNNNSRKKLINIHSSPTFRFIPKQNLREMLMTQFLPFFLYETMKEPKIERKGGYINKIGKKPKTYKDPMDSLRDQKFKQMILSSRNKKNSRDAKLLFLSFLTFLSNIESKKLKNHRKKFMRKIYEENYEVIVLPPKNIIKVINSQKVKYQKRKHSIKKALKGTTVAVTELTEKFQKINASLELVEKETFKLLNLSNSLDYNLTSDKQFSGETNHSNRIVTRKSLYSTIPQKENALYVSLFMIALIIGCLILTTRKKLHYADDDIHINSSLHRYYSIDLAGFDRGYSRNCDSEDSSHEIEHGILKKFTNIPEKIKKSAQGYKCMKKENSYSGNHLTPLKNYQASFTKNVNKISLLTKDNEDKSLKSDTDIDSDTSNESYVSVINNINDIDEVKPIKNNAKNSQIQSVTQLIDLINTDKNGL